MVGISTREVHNGVVELRQVSDILGELAAQFQAGAISAEQMSIVLEQLGGQRQADILAAMIQNWHLYEDAMKNFEDGQGSAAREAQRTAESWEGQLNRLRNAWVAFVSEFTSAGSIIPQLLGHIIRVVEALARAASTPFGQFTAVVLAAAVAIKILSAAVFAFKSTVFGSMLLSLTKFKIGLKALKVYLLGVSAAFTGGAAAGTKFKTVLLALKVNPLILALTAVSAAIVGVVVAVNSAEARIQAYIDAADELVRKNRELDSTLTSNTQTLRSLESEFDNLSRGVDRHGNNIALTDEEYRRYLEIVNILIDINPDLVDGWNAQGDAIIDNNTALQRTNELLEEQQMIRIRERASLEATQTRIDGLIASQRELYRTSGGEGFDLGRFIERNRHFANAAVSVGAANRISTNGVADLLGIGVIVNDDQAVIDNFREIMSLAEEAGASTEELEEFYKYFSRYTNRLAQNSEETQRVIREQMSYTMRSVEGYGDLSRRQQVFLTTIVESTIDFNNIDLRDFDVEEFKTTTTDLTQLIIDNQEAIEVYIDTIVNLDTTGMSADEIVREYDKAIDSIDEIFKSLGLDVDVYMMVKPLLEFDEQALRELRNRLRVLLGDDFHRGELNFAIHNMPLNELQKLTMLLADVKKNGGDTQEVFRAFSNGNLLQQINEINEAFENNKITVNEATDSIRQAIIDAFDGIISDEQLDVLMYRLTPTIDDVAFQSLRDLLGTTTSEMNLFNQAQREMDENGRISAQTLDRLIEAGFEDYIDRSTGVIRVNVQALKEQRREYINLRIAKAQDAIATNNATIAELKKTDATYENIEAVKQQIEAYKFRNEELEGHIDNYELVRLALEDMTDAYRNFADMLSSNISNAELLNRAHEEMIEYGEISTNTLTALARSGMEYLEYLDESSGKLVLNTVALRANERAARENERAKEVDAYNSLQAQINANEKALEEIDITRERRNELKRLNETLRANQRTHRDNIRNIDITTVAMDRLGRSTSDAAEAQRRHNSEIRSNVSLLSRARIEMIRNGRLSSDTLWGLAEQLPNIAELYGTAGFEGALFREIQSELGRIGTTTQSSARETTVMYQDEYRQREQDFQEHNANKESIHDGSLDSRSEATEEHFDDQERTQRESYRTQERATEVFTDNVVGHIGDMMSNLQPKYDDNAMNFAKSVHKMVNAAEQGVNLMNNAFGSVMGPQVSPGFGNPIIGQAGFGGAPIGSVEKVSIRDAARQLPPGTIIPVTDAQTGRTFNLVSYSPSGSSHVDVVSATAQDQRTMDELWGERTWRSRPIFVTLPDGRVTAASTHNMPHESGQMGDGSAGHTCLWFYGSRSNNGLSQSYHNDMTRSIGEAFQIGQNQINTTLQSNAQANQQISGYVQKLSNAEFFRAVGGQGNVVEVWDRETGQTFRAQVNSFREGYHLDWFPADEVSRLFVESLRSEATRGLRVDGGPDFLPRAAIVTAADGTRTVGSFNTAPHGSQANWGGGIRGHACMHFLDSPSAAHIARGGLTDPRHQNLIRDTYQELNQGVNDWVVNTAQNTANQAITQLPSGGAGHISNLNMGALAGSGPIGINRGWSGNEQIDATIAAASIRYGIPADLIAAVIKRESNFRNNVTSSAGAQGLMQFMPPTARYMGVTDPWNIEQNIHGGARYIKYLLDMFDGNLERALAAYNWGPGALRNSGALQGTDGLNRSMLPRETYNYLNRITSTLEEYLGMAISGTATGFGGNLQPSQQFFAPMPQIELTTFDSFLQSLNACCHALNNLSDSAEDASDSVTNWHPGLGSITLGVDTSAEEVIDELHNLEAEIAVIPDEKEFRSAVDGLFDAVGGEMHLLLGSHGSSAASVVEDMADDFEEAVENHKETVGQAVEQIATSYALAGNISNTMLQEILAESRDARIELERQRYELQYEAGEITRAEFNERVSAAEQLIEAQYSFLEDTTERQLERIRNERRIRDEAFAQELSDLQYSFDRQLITEENFLLQKRDLIEKYYGDSLRDAERYREQMLQIDVALRQEEERRLMNQLNRARDYYDFDGQIRIYRELQANVQGMVDEFLSRGFAEDSNEIMELQAQIRGYEQDIRNVVDAQRQRAEELLRLRLDVAIDTDDFEAQLEILKEMRSMQQEIVDELNSIDYGAIREEMNSILDEWNEINISVNIDADNIESVIDDSLMELREKYLELSLELDDVISEWEDIDIEINIDDTDVELTDENLIQLRKRYSELSQEISNIVNEWNQANIEISIDDNIELTDENLIRLRDRYRELQQIAAEEVRVTIDLMEAEAEIRALNSRIIQTFGEMAARAREVFERELSRLDFRMSVTLDSDYARQEELLNQKIEQRLALSQKLLDQYMELQLTVDENVKSTREFQELLQSIIAEYDANVKAIYDLVQAQRNLAESQVSHVRDINNRIIDIIRQRYQDEFDAFERTNRAKLDALNAERDAINDNRRAQLDAIDAEMDSWNQLWRAEDRRRRDETRQRDIDDLDELRSRANRLMIAANSGDAEAISRLEDINRQIRDRGQRLADQQEQDARQDIRDDISARRDAVNESFDNQNQAVEDRIALLQDELQAMRDIFDENMSNENLQVQARQKLARGLNDYTIGLLHEFEDRFGEGMGILGEYVHQQLGTQITTWQNALGDLVRSVGLLGSVDGMLSGFGDDHDSLSDRQVDLLGSVGGVLSRFTGVYEGLSERQEQLLNAMARHSERLDSLSDDQIEVIKQMEENTRLWKKATDELERAALLAENLELGESIGLTYDDGSGAWYLDEEKTELAFSTLRGIHDLIMENSWETLEAHNDELKSYNEIQAIKTRIYEQFSDDVQSETDFLYRYLINRMEEFGEEFEVWIEQMKAFVKDLYSAIKSAMKNLNIMSDTARSFGVEVVSSTTMRQLNSGGRIERFATGGQVRTGGLAILDPNERVLTAAQTAGFNRLVSNLDNFNQLYDSLMSKNDFSVNGNQSVGANFNFYGSITQEAMPQIQQMMDKAVSDLRKDVPHIVSNRMIQDGKQMGTGFRR